MSVNTREQWELEFVDGLVEAGDENMKLTGGDDDRRQAMWNIANPIIKAIKRGVATIHFVGSFSVTQLNALQSKEQNGIYGVTDDGLLTNPDGTTLQVTAGSSVMWDGSWREFLDIDLSGYYTKEQVDSLIATAAAEFTSAVANESSLRESADATLQGNIDAEASERSSADNALDERVAYLEEATSSYEVNSNKVNAIDDSTTHYPTTHAVTTAIVAEATARESADSALDARIDGEETAREQADGELQAQIDAISSKSDVVDVVASYVELIAYDTSALGDNDVIKVLEDETHDDAESYYRWNLTTQTWGYIGSQGPFVTPAEMQSALNGKVDKVAGKGLSTNDYTTSEKNKLAGIEAGAQVNNIFVALYNGNHNHEGNTPYADINDAYQDGKRLLCWNSASNARRLYTLNGFNVTDKIFKFTSCGGSGEDILEVSFAYMEGNINNTECQTKNYLLAKRNHASTTTDYGGASASSYGHVKLSDSIDSTSGVNDGVAATPNAVRAALNETTPVSRGGTGATTAAGARTNLGLGNVENESVSNGTPDFTEASTRTNIASGEKMSTLFGKIKKWFTDLKTVAFTGSYNDLTDKPTIPSAQVNSDWSASSGVAQILNKPVLGTAAASNAADFATATQGIKADSAIQSVKVDGEELTPDSNKAVNIALSTSIGHIITARAPAGKWIRILSLDPGFSTYFSHPLTFKVICRGGCEHNGYIRYRNSETYSIDSAEDLLLGNDHDYNLATTEPLYYTLNATTHVLDIWVRNNQAGRIDMYIEAGFSIMGSISYPSETTVDSRDSLPSGAIAFSKKRGVDDSDYVKSITTSTPIIQVTRDGGSVNLTIVNGTIPVEKLNFTPVTCEPLTFKASYSASKLYTYGGFLYKFVGNVGDTAIFKNLSALNDVNVIGVTSNDIVDMSYDYDVFNKERHFGTTDVYVFQFNPISGYAKPSYESLEEALSRGLLPIMMYTTEDDDVVIFQGDKRNRVYPLLYSSCSLNEEGNFDRFTFVRVVAGSVQTITLNYKFHNYESYTDRSSAIISEAGTPQIVNGAVTEAKLASNSVTTGKIVNGAVTEAKLASNSVTTGKIVNGAVTEAKLANSAVTTSKINDGAVNADKLASNIVAAMGGTTSKALGIVVFSVSAQYTGSINGHTYLNESEYKDVDENSNNLHSLMKNAYGANEYIVLPTLTGTFSAGNFYSYCNVYTSGVVPYYHKFNFKVLNSTSKVMRIVFRNSNASGNLNLYSAFVNGKEYSNSQVNIYIAAGSSAEFSFIRTIDVDSKASIIIEGRGFTDN